MAAMAVLPYCLSSAARSRGREGRYDGRGGGVPALACSSTWHRLGVPQLEATHSYCCCVGNGSCLWAPAGGQCSQRPSTGMEGRWLE